jgi:hypothetical protein
MRKNEKRRFSHRKAIRYRLIFDDVVQKVSTDFRLKQHTTHVIAILIIRSACTFVASVIKKQPSAALAVKTFGTAARSAKSSTGKRISNNAEIIPSLIRRKMDQLLLFFKRERQWSSIRFLGAVILTVERVK